MKYTLRSVSSKTFPDHTHLLFAYIIIIRNTTRRFQRISLTEIQVVETIVLLKFMYSCKFSFFIIVCSRD